MKDKIFDKACQLKTDIKRKETAIAELKRNNLDFMEIGNVRIPAEIAKNCRKKTIYRFQLELRLLIRDFDNLKETP